MLLFKVPQTHGLVTRWTLNSLIFLLSCLLEDQATVWWKTINLAWVLSLLSSFPPVCVFRKCFLSNISYQLLQEYLLSLSCLTLSQVLNQS